MEDYEAQRAATIAQNKALIASLGLAKPKVKRASPSHEISESNPPKAKKARLVKTVIEPSRRSTRLVESASKEEHVSLPDDFSDAELTRRATKRNGLPSIRQLAAPEFPEPAEEISHDPDYRASPPSRDEGNSGFGRLHFEDTPHFTPNLTPEDVMRLGSFGGTYWRPFYSSVCRQEMDADYDEFPEEWYQGIDKDNYLSSQEYDPDLNMYHVKASQSIEDWEKAGWIRSIDPRGWMQWYCRFYLGRRTPDDDRQIRRYLSAVGPRGRFKTQLVKKIAAAGGAEEWDNHDIAPILRQTLQHWAVRVTKEDMLEYLVPTV